MTALAAVADLEARLGVGEDSLADTELARAQAALDDVSAEVLHITGASWTDSDVPDVVVRVVLAAAKRIFLNPQDYSFEQAGDYSWRANTAGAGELLADSERARIMEAAGLYAVGSTQTPLPDDHFINAGRQGVGYVTDWDFTLS